MTEEDIRTQSGQKAFGAALLDADLPPPPGLRGVNGGTADRRFAVYRNNVTVSLVNALAEIFPTVQRLVGEDYFRALARLYVAAEPPTSRLLFEYGGGFADFVAAFEPARHLTFLPDVARLERHWLDVFHEADAVPLAAAAMAGIAQADLPHLGFVPHPALRVLRFDHAAITILARDRAGQSLEGIDPAKAEDGLLTRPGHDVQLRWLPPGAAILLEALRDGQSLGEAAGAALAIAPDLDLAGAIQTMLEAGCFIAINAPKS